MKLYLSSLNVGNEPEKLTGLLGKNKKAAVIMNAADNQGIRRRERYAQELVSLSRVEIEGDELDLRDYFGVSHAQLEIDLRQYGLVWVAGGNTFILRRAMHQSRFDNVIRKLLLEDVIVYAGYSAGACVTAPTLKGLELVDKPDSVPPYYEEPVIWDGLGLTSYSIAPHYRSPDHAESAAVEKMVQYFEDNGMPYRALSDGEAIVVDQETGIS